VQPFCGGGRLGGPLARGWFVSPTVFGDVDHDSDLARMEVFGPVLEMLVRKAVFEHPIG
jgi:aldehyde dehydrogenase (NAD+)